jgi:hypothetical protein
MLSCVYRLAVSEVRLALPNFHWAGRKSRKGKTDADGSGRIAYLSRETVKWLRIWLDHAKISEGPICRRLIGRDEIGDALQSGSIAPIFKRVAQWIGMPARFVAEVSGHSTRAGAAMPTFPKLPKVEIRDTNTAKGRGVFANTCAPGRSQPLPGLRIRQLNLDIGTSTHTPGQGGHGISENHH